MPVCTNCAGYMEHLYTKYSENNVRLEQCPNCNNFADEYVEKDALNIALDLILLKGVLLHLLFNRGEGVREVHRDGGQIRASGKNGSNRVRTLVKVGSSLILLDSFIRWSQIEKNTNRMTDSSTISTFKNIQLFLRILFGCLIETTLFHTCICIACSIALAILGIFRGNRPLSGVEREFKISHVSLALLYSSLPKLFLLSLLVIWKPTISSRHYRTSISANYEFLVSALQLFDESSIDREWLLRNVLGGIASGFSLRVVLDGHPLIATLIVLVGWTAKAIAAAALNKYIVPISPEREWLIFSMP